MQFDFTLLFHTAIEKKLTLLLYPRYRQQLFNHHFIELEIRLPIFLLKLTRSSLSINSISTYSRSIPLCSKAFKSYLNGANPKFPKPA